MRCCPYAGCFKDNDDLLFYLISKLIGTGCQNRWFVGQIAQTVGPEWHVYPLRRLSNLLFNPFSKTIEPKLTRNYEISKLAIENGFFSLVGIYLIFFVVVMLFLRRLKLKEFLSREASDELRGIGILLVIVGHIAIHVVNPSINSLALSDFGVSLFFILSGYGLARTYYTKVFNLKIFIWRRLSRVLVPYWLATLLIVILDYFILKRQYSALDLGLTLAGINFSIVARHIDYVRWYITALILWYTLFAICWSNLTKKRVASIILLLGLILFVSNYYWLHLGYAFFSFPAGVILGLYSDRINEKLLLSNRNILLIIVASGMAFSYFCMHNIIPEIIGFLPYIIIELIKEILWIAFVLCLVVLSSVYAAYKSGFLVFIGKYSYELFLFHGVFMIKYDFILFKAPLYLSFWPYLAFIVIISVLINKFILSRIQKCILKTT